MYATMSSTSKEAVIKDAVRELGLETCSMMWLIVKEMVETRLH